MKRLLILAALALIGAADDGPSAYRVKLAVTPVAGAKVQRIVVPAAALVVSQVSDLADLRVFDARGRAMPIARAPAAQSALKRDTLAALPILGPADSLRVTGMSLRLDDLGRARVAQVDGEVAEAKGDTILLGALFGARATHGTAERLTLDVDIPVSQPVTFTVAASRDLKDWRTIGEQVLYRAPDAPRADLAIALGQAGIDRDYLRVTWKSTARLLSPIAVRSGTLLTRSDGTGGVATIDATLPDPATGKAIDIAIPFHTPLTTLRIMAAGEDAIVPVRVLGRDTNEQPWTLLGSGVARVTDAADIALSGIAFRTLRIEADVRTNGFTAPPTLRLGFVPQAIAFLTAGEAPYTLAAGQAGAADVYLPFDSLTGGSTSPLPEAQIAAGTKMLPLALVDAAGANDRQFLLWAILLGATALLAGMAWLLWRRNGAPA